MPHTLRFAKWELVSATKVIAFLSRTPQWPRALHASQGKSVTGASSLKVDVGLVVVHATAFDPDYRFVKGLEKEEFEVYQDKVPQNNTSIFCYVF